MIKNLKIYHYSNKNKKKKLSKLKISLAGIFLTTTILATSYANYYNNKYRSSDDEIVETTDITQNTTMADSTFLIDASNIPSERVVDWGIGGNPITISNSASQEFINYLDQIETTYEYEELYNLDQTIAQYQKIKNKEWNRTGTNILEHNSVISSSELFTMVKKNNKRYFEKKAQAGSFVTYEELSDTEIRRAIDVVTETVNDMLRENKNIDRTQLGYTLGNLKILADASPNNAFVTEDGCLIINLDMISVLQEMYPKEDAYTMVMTHEAVHLLQGYGAKNEYPVILEHVLTEASAEKVAADYRHTNPLTYEAMIGYLNSLNLATILNDNVGLNQIENNSFTNNLDNYFVQFNCTTDKQKLEFLKMTKALNIMQLGDTDFYENYKNKMGTEMPEEEKKHLNHRLKTYIYETVTKIFYRDLTKKMTNNNTTVQDIFYLITLFETDINSHIKYNEEDRKQYNSDFMMKYTEIQTQFFQLMSSTNTYTYDEIINMYNSYGSKVTDGKMTMDNCQLNWLSPEKREYILNKNKEMEFRGTASIYESSVNYSKNK